MAKYKKMMPPRRTSIRGQNHLLAYITPEEAALLKARGGTGEAGPMGIPAFAEDDGDEDASSGAAASGTSGEEDAAGGAASDGGAFSGGGEDTSEGAAYDYSQFYQETPSQYGGPSDYSLIGTTPAVNQYDAEVATLQQLNRDLQNLSRREAMYSSMSGMPLLGIPGYLGLQNVRNLASAAIGSPPGLLSSLGLGGLGIGSFKIGDRVPSTFGGLSPSELAALQSRAIRGPIGTDPFGRPQEGIVGFRDAYGNVQFGTDPNEQYDMSEGSDVKPVDPVTGQCEEGYIFDEDLQACRLDTGASAAGAAGTPPAPGGYARMGLLDVAPTGLPDFQQRYGVGFGTPQDFTAANLNFKRQGATYPEYFKRPPQLSGYTLLS